MSAPLTEPSLLGAVLAGRYEIRARLGRGGMGEVFEAVDRRLGRTVAVKVLRAELAADERFLVRFRREASIAAGLAHPGIVAVHDIGDDAGFTFIVMEFVAGRTLADVDLLGALDVSRIARIGSAAARALGHAHDRGVVHRDISPSNVMLTADGTVKVLDFGIARDDGGSTASRGTLAYVAPEVLGGGRVDARADVFALGAVLAELARGTTDPSGRLAEVIDRATDPRPERRFVSAIAFAAALDEVVVGVSEPAPSRAGQGRDHRDGDHTAPIVRIATRPLGSAISRSEGATLEPGRAASRRGPGEVGALAPARGLAVVRDRRPRRRPLARVVLTGALVLVALGGAIVLGQALLSARSPKAAVTVTGPEPVPRPARLTAAASCDGLFSTRSDLAWNGRAPADGYEIWRSGSGDEPVLVARVRGVHTEAFRDVDLGVDASYTYRVRAFDGPRVSAWSNEVDVRTPFLCLT